ncbi:MAG: hypothetical protein RMM08_08850 [Armatimonadota bacterium]|nr:hypothetical protein [bacterium]MDW8321459.1 hypothetical protein [Armatimonadota bacterium]
MRSSPVKARNLCSCPSVNIPLVMPAQAVVGQSGVWDECAEQAPAGGVVEGAKQGERQDERFGVAGTWQDFQLSDG